MNLSRLTLSRCDARPLEGVGGSSKFLLRRDSLQINCCTNLQRERVLGLFSSGRVIRITIPPIGRGTVVLDEAWELTT